MMDSLDANSSLGDSLNDYSWILDSPGQDRLVMGQFDTDDLSENPSPFYSNLSSLRNSTPSPFQPQAEVIDYESLLVDKPDEEMICTLCYTLMTDPVILSPCGHTFCNDCLANRTVCPYHLGCPSPNITSRTPNRLFKKSIDKLNMKCRFSCGKIFPLEARERHEKECLSAPIECPNGCQKAGLYRFNLRDHFDACPRKKNICECGKAVSAEDLVYHLKNQCDAPKQCQFCEQQFEEKDQQSHNDSCNKRKLMVIKQLFPQIENDLEFVEEIITSVKGNMDQILNEITTLYHPVGSILEVFNLSANVQEHHLQELFSQLCPGVSFRFDFAFSDGTWVWLHLPSDEAAAIMLATLHANGFPYIRLPISEGRLWLGSTNQMTFCPPMSTFDCPIHPYTMPSCPFKHNVYKNGQCIRWKAGQLCGKPTTCKFAHPGKTILDLKFMSRTPNICKFCQKSSHFGWECPDRVNFNTSKDIINHVEGVARTLEQILQNEGGQMLANRAGIALRRANPATAAVLSEQFGGKLKKLLEAYSHKFTITNQEQPGFAIIQLNNGNFPRFPGSLNSGLSPGNFSDPFSMSPSGTRPFRKVAILEREWSRDEEFLPFIYNVMHPHFEKIRTNPKTDRRLVPNLQELVNMCQDFEADGANINQLKLGMRVLAETIATIQLGEIENFDPHLDFKSKIRRLQLHNINFARALNLVRKYSNPPEMIASPSNDATSIGFQNLNEADSLAECFNRLTEALGIFFRYSNEISQRRDRDAFNLNGSDNSQGNFQHENLGPISSLFGGMSIFGNSASSLQDDSSHVPLFQRSNLNSTFNLNSSFSGRSTPEPFNFNASNGSSPVNSPLNYASIFSPVASSPNSYAPYPHIPTYSHGNSQSSHGSQGYSDAASLFSGSPILHENSMNVHGMYNSGFHNSDVPMGNPNLHHHNPNYSNAYPNTTNSYGRTVTTEKVCLNCGAVNSHTSSQCRGCSWCGRTNHVPEQCTSKLPRCGYCSKQHNKGLGHKTRDCRYLQSGKGV